MQLWLTRLVADWWKDDVNGVNAMLELLRQAPDESTDFIPDAVAYIGDSTRDEVVKRKQEPPATPALYVTPDGPLAMSGEVPTDTQRDTLPGQGFALAARVLLDESETVQAEQACNYILRAMVMSLKRLLDNGSELEGADHEATVRGDCEIISCDSLTYGPIAEKVGSVRVVGALGAQFTARDNAP